MVIINYKHFYSLSSNFTGKMYTENKKIFFYKNKLIHRYYGAAYVDNFNNFNSKSWDFNGKCYGWSPRYNQKQFFKDIKLSWLI